MTKEDIRSTLTAFDFEGLFLLLGWDRYRHVTSIEIGDQTYALSALAHKRGMVAFLCVIAPNQEFPDRSIRLKIEKILARIVLEHILVFVDEAKTIQEWQWSKREPGRPLSVKKETVLPWQSGERLAQRLMNLAFTIQEEETLTLVDVTSRVRRAFDADVVTKQFYEQFSKEHDNFLNFIEGIPNLADREWYASLMLNRLMFVYFIQKKGFLDGDHNYLRNRLSSVKLHIGPDRFHSFYRSFLLRLFHDGLGSRDRSPELTELLGKVPYLNGGIFDVHSLEASHPEIEIPDEAFEKVFGFFDDYKWHLDDRPLRDDKEINPDVLGFIFEKYINNKQMGAYYTKEDITEYICRNTVIPWIFDDARRHVPIAFERGSALWRLLQDNPDRYIYEPVKRGVDVPEADLPDFVRRAMADPRERMLNRQYNLVEARLLDGNGNSITLPTETWRDYIERRERCHSLRLRLREGSVADMSELVTLNLDLRQFAQDALEASEGPDLLRALFRAVQDIKILDPTCGSGAFLFAALNILEPLYEASLDRMSAFVEDADTLTEIRSSGAAASNWKGELNFDVLIGQGTFSEDVVESVQFVDFRQTLADIDLHTNKRYFILKSIIIANLFGVDIMPEAVEICKLRLFLKLVSQVEPTDGADNLGIEPLPDVDFNVVSGNTLVGYSRISHIDELWEQVQLGTATTTGTLAFERDHSRLTSLCAEYAVVGDAFRNEMLGIAGPRVTKNQVRAASNRIRPEVDQDIWRLHRTALSRWANTRLVDFKSSHMPFHWFVEFPSVLLAGGGFSVVVGNPPYVEIEKITSSYGLLGYQSIGGGNLYSLVMERSLSVCAQDGRLGMIVPVSSVCTGDFSELQDTLVGSGAVHIASFNDRPGKLFEGLEHIRLSIILCDKSRSRSVKTTRYSKWATEARSHLFPNLTFGDATGLRSPGSIPKVSNGIEAAILQRIRATPDNVSSRIADGGDAVLYYTRKLSGFVQVIDFVPEIRVGNGQLERPSELKELRFSSERERAIVQAALNSSLFFLYLTMVSDCRNLNQREVKAMSLPISSATDAQVQRLEQLSSELSQRLASTSRVVTSNYKKYGRKDIQCIYPKLAKDIIDQIDIVLGAALGLDDVELDYVVNFDIRFRVGVGSE